jgi:hypothetical protein
LDQYVLFDEKVDDIQAESAVPEILNSSGLTNRSLYLDASYFLAPDEARSLTGCSTPWRVRHRPSAS